MNKIEQRLLALTDSTWRRGREIRTLYRQRHMGGIGLSYGTLYVKLRRLCEHGLVESVSGEDEFGSWKAFRITDAGQKARKALEP